MLCAAALAAPSPALADDGPRDAPAPRVSGRADLLFRFTPQARLTVEEGASGAVDRYWRALATAPLYARAYADARDLWGGRVEAHVSGWAAVDLFASQEQVAAGDLALAWASVRLGPHAAWLGRRFVAWGLPGGAHLDGGGAAVRTAFGLTLEAIAGRPVTPRFGGSLGSTPSFDGAEAVWGVRASYANPGRFTASASWMERWGRGVPAQRALSVEALWMPSARVDLRGAAVLDGGSGDLVQARVEALVLLGRRNDVSAGWTHADVARLIPRWSILSVFAGPVYDELFVGGAWRPTRGLSVGLEAALRLLQVPGRDQSDYGPNLASRVDLRVRVAPSLEGPQGLLHLSRRDDGVRSLTVLRAVGSFPLHRVLDGMLEASAALDGDDFGAPRSAYYGRATLEVKLGGPWRLGATVDATRAVAISDIRGAINASWVAPTSGGAR